MRSRMKPVLALAVALASIVVVAEPASATTYPVTADLEYGRRTIVTNGFGTLVADTPGNPVPGCPGARTLTAEFDDVADEVRDLTISIKDPFITPLFGTYHQLETTSLDRTDGTWDPSTGEWSGAREMFSFQIRSFDRNGCVEGAVECEGSVTMELSGTTLFQHAGGPVEGPIPGPTGPVWVQAASDGTFTLGTCSLPLWFIILDSSTMTLGANPTVPAHAGDPGAEFR